MLTPEQLAMMVTLAEATVAARDRAEDRLRAILVECTRALAEDDPEDLHRTLKYTILLATPPEEHA